MASGIIRTDLILLWENPAPTSNMSATKIALDLSGYSEIRLYYKSSGNGTTIFTRDIPNVVGFNASAEVYGNPTGSSDVILYRRQFDVLSDGIYVNDGTSKNVKTSAASTSVNSICIPWRIYGRL